MIPNGKKMNWHGHHLTFESEDDRCRGCFFADKNECPDCDEGVWAEDNPNPWNAGTPTEEGWYLTSTKASDYSVHYFDGSKWDFCSDDFIIAWMPIPPFETKPHITKLPKEWYDPADDDWYKDLVKEQPV